MAKFTKQELGFLHDLLNEQIEIYGELDAEGDISYEDKLWLIDAVHLGKKISRELNYQ